MSEKQNKNVTVRVQKIKKNHIKQKLVFFLILAIGLVILAVFSEHLCPYDPYAQDLASALQPPSLQHPMGTDTYGRDMLSRVISGARASIFSTFILVAVIFVLGTPVLTASMAEPIKVLAWPSPLLAIKSSWVIR